MTEISGKTAVVTGGGSGIGEALCIERAAAGARVVVADIIYQQAEAGAESVRGASGEAVGLAGGAWGRWG